MSDSFIEDKLKSVKFTRRDLITKGPKVLGGVLAAFTVGKYIKREGDTEHVSENTWRSIEGADGGIYTHI